MQTYMPESLSRIKNYDMTCVAQFPLKKKHAPEEPKCRADILVYVAKDIIHVSILSILTASDTKTKSALWILNKIVGQHFSKHRKVDLSMEYLVHVIVFLLKLQQPYILS